MNTHLLKFKYIFKHLVYIQTILFFAFIAWFLIPLVLKNLFSLFVPNTFFKFYLILLTALSLASYLCNSIVMIRIYRYRNGRKMLFHFISPMQVCQFCALLVFLSVSDVPYAYRISLFFFLSGLVFYWLSKEIRRAKKQGFEKCGIWQTRYVLGIILMLPLPVYAIYDILRALGLL